MITESASKFKKRKIHLMQGDCLDKMKAIAAGSVDMVLADPPYGMTDCKWDSVIPLTPMWEQLKRIITPNGAIVMTASQPFTTTLIGSNMKMFKYCWVWEKNTATGHLNAKKMPMKNAEDVLVFYKRQPTYNPQGVIDCKIEQTGGCGAIYGSKPKKKYIQTKKNYPKTIQKFKSERGTVHPTQKPVALMEYLIKTYTNEGETVLDFVMGSGTTGVACKKLNRNFIGIEQLEKYFKIAQDRISGASCEKN